MKNSKFDRLFNTIMEEVKFSKIKAKKVIKEDNDDYIEDWNSEYDNIVDLLANETNGVEVCEDWNNIDWACDLIDQLNNKGIHSKKEGYEYIRNEISTAIDNAEMEAEDWEEKVCDMIDEEFDKLLKTYSPKQQQILEGAYEEWYDVQSDVCVDIRNRLSQKDFKNEEIVRAQIRKHFEKGFKEVLENYRKDPK